MRGSRPLFSPVITLLSPSPAASRRAQDSLSYLFGLQAIPLACRVKDDELNAKLRWDSVVSQCPRSRALVHWLSLEDAKDEQGSFSLLSVSHGSDPDLGIPRARNLLSSNFPHSMLGMKLLHFFQRPMTVDALLKRHQGLPLLDLPTEESTKDNQVDSSNSPRLKEVAFTIQDEAVYEDGSSVFSNLSQSALERPVAGLYEWPKSHGVCLRPLPMAKQDLKRSPRPLVLTFHCQSLEQVQDESVNMPIQLSKIGFNGQGNGQLRVKLMTGNSNTNNPLNGLDLRWCEKTKPTSVFQEAQESLLASSLPELQSTNVLKSTGKSEPGAEDSRIGSADCWIEFRNMAKNPGGFVPSKGPRVATAPPSYPE